MYASSYKADQTIVLYHHLLKKNGTSSFAITFDYDMAIQNVPCVRMHEPYQNKPNQRRFKQGEI